MTIPATASCSGNAGRIARVLWRPVQPPPNQLEVGFASLSLQAQSCRCASQHATRGIIAPTEYRFSELLVEAERAMAGDAGPFLYLAQQSLADGMHRTGKVHTALLAQATGGRCASSHCPADTAPRTALLPV